ncbi:hypothetical protein [Xenorhabdus entomophaga]
MNNKSHPTWGQQKSGMMGAYQKPHLKIKKIAPIPPLYILVYFGLFSH